MLQLLHDASHRLLTKDWKQQMFWLFTIMRHLWFVLGVPKRFWWIFLRIYSSITDFCFNPSLSTWKDSCMTHPLCFLSRCSLNKNLPVLPLFLPVVSQKTCTSTVHNFKSEQHSGKSLSSLFNHFVNLFCDNLIYYTRLY